MKFLEVPALLDLSTRYFNGLDLGDRQVFGAVEAYSCKMVKADKKLSRELENKMAAEYSPAATSPLGPIGRSSTRDLLCSLIGTLNASFTDYEFSAVRPDMFHREHSLNDVANTVNNTVVDAIDKVRPGFKNRFWADLSAAITLDHCEIYRLVGTEMPGADDDGFVHLDPVNFFFFNKHRKMILFFHAYCKSNLHGGASAPASQADEMFPVASLGGAGPAAEAGARVDDGGDGADPPNLLI